ncbi:uncharacterized protein LOC113024001 isoform X2 [Astatotilapia calliptera]|nr:uncharacterized protein LOC113024001 isoform X2 [Astatotilapia calliptera]
MGFTALHTLWLLTAFAFTTQELVKLRVSPKITAECGEQVSLNCNTSSVHHGISIKLMQWFKEETLLCSVDSKGITTELHRASLSNFTCEYEDGRLSLIFKKMLPPESGKKYTCKQRSNRGALNESTKVELQECGGIVEGKLTTTGPVCTFKQVYPDGNVHWFHGSRNLSDGSLKQYTGKSVDEQGWLTIHSYLERNSSHGPYNCSLKSTVSDKYIASMLIQNPKPQKSTSGTHSNGNKVTARESTRTIFCLLILLPVIFK